MSKTKSNEDEKKLGTSTNISVYITSQVSKRINEQDIQKALEQFVNNHWGTLCEYDKRSNQKNVEQGQGMILGAYECKAEKIWIIKDADWKTVTVLLPEEY